MFTRHSRSTIVRAGFLGALIALAIASVAGAESVIGVSDNNATVASNNQTPASACHNQVPVNALGVQVPVQEVEAAAGVDALNPGSNSPVTQDESCDATMAQNNDAGNHDADAQETDDADSAVAVSNNNATAASGNQTPVSACHNQVPVNALGVQVPVQEVEAAAGVDALNPDSNSPVTQDDSCSPTLAQNNDVGNHDAGAQETDDADSTVAVSDNNVPAASNNQTPVSACHNQVPVNALGVQVPVHEIAAAVGLALLSEGSSTPVTQDESCDSNLAQNNNVGTTTTRPAR